MTKFNLTKIEMDDMVSTMADADGVEKQFSLQPPIQQPELWDDLDDCDTNGSIEIEIVDECEDDGQPSEYDEWQDHYGGDDFDYGTYGQSDY
jgi:hypothetical protein|tara:strand:- start:66 stop:341 length:276 start_codon:yes stop_codon:yes gene_type:complete